MDSQDDKIKKRMSWLEHLAQLWAPLVPVSMVVLTISEIILLLRT